MASRNGFFGGAGLVRQLTERTEKPCPEFCTNGGDGLFVPGPAPTKLSGDAMTLLMGPPNHKTVPFPTSVGTVSSIELCLSLLFPYIHTKHHGHNYQSYDEGRQIPCK